MRNTAVLPQNATAVHGIAYEEMSEAQRLALSPPELVDQFFARLSDDELLHIPYWWEFWARPKQKAPPGNWSYWLLLGGRGFGKTRALVEWIIQKALDMPGSRGAIVGQTAGDVRDVLIDGESGILACSPPDFMPVYNASKRRLTWPNGTTATLFSAEKPDSLRGPQFHWAAADELAAWRYTEAWDMLQFGLRLGDNPQCAIATTPRPIPILVGQLDNPELGLLNNPHCVVTTGTTYENRSNLAESFFRQVISRYEGSRLGRQELLGAILSDTPGALWNHDLLEKTRHVDVIPPMFRIVVAVDPASSTGQTGVMVVGVAKVRGAVHGYVLEDATPPPGVESSVWAQAAIDAYNRWEADLVVAEVNHGGDMVRNVIRNVKGGQLVKYKAVRASRGKYVRAEPVSTLFEQGIAHMCGSFAHLEDELCAFVPGKVFRVETDESGHRTVVYSPNRLDAMVWGFTELMVDGKKMAKAR